MIHICAVCGNEELAVEALTYAETVDESLPVGDVTEALELIPLFYTDAVKALMEDIDQEIEYAKTINPQMALGMTMIRDKIVKHLK